MKRTSVFMVLSGVAAILAAGCEPVDTKGTEEGGNRVALREVAELFAELPIGREQIVEVRDAVSSSSGNGFDEEYLMKKLFESPGEGVGEEFVSTKAEAKVYETPLRDLIREKLGERAAVKSSSGEVAGATGPEDFISALTSSGTQIYWPYYNNWDGRELPIITYAPDDGMAETNIGWRLFDRADGSRGVEKVVVDEETAKEHPVWVVNSNEDSGFKPLELIRKNDPSWGKPGGSISVETKAGTGTVRTLILKDFTMNRNYDCWFAGASEFFVKIGSVEGFWASTEAEMRVFSPTVTDFMIVVRRGQKGEAVPFNAVLVSEWTDQLDKCAFVITEDDGGTVENWKCSATVKFNSKAYGIDISIPIYSKDDIVWRGQLSKNYIETNNNVVGHFGDVDLTFQITETVNLL